MIENFIDKENGCEKNYVIRTYGRTKAHGLSQTQENNLKTLYPVYGISLPNEKIDPHEFFDNYFNLISFEIGFGNGEHLIEMAKRNPNVGFIGCEPFENGVVSALDGIQRNRLNNVRVYKGDAREVLNLIGDHSLDRMYILFPDPWRKKRHYKRRLISENFLRAAQEKMKKFRCLVIATDHEDYRNDILNHLHSVNAVFDENVIFERPKCFSGTKYERKAIARGAKCVYIRVYQA